MVLELDLVSIEISGLIDEPHFFLKLVDTKRCASLGKDALEKQGANGLH